MMMPCVFASRCACAQFAAAVYGSFVRRRQRSRMLSAVFLLMRA